MTLQEQLLALSEYKVGLNVYDKNFVVQIYYPIDWQIMKPTNDDILFTQDKSDNTLYYYIAPITTNIDNILEVIHEVIEYNKEIEEKVKLFNIKLIELKHIFQTERLSVLNTLEFKYKKKKERRKSVEEEVIENGVENNKENNKIENDADI